MKALFIEPFDAGSHAQFTRWITEGIDAEWTVLTMPGRHWKWRMRGSAVWFASEHRDVLAQHFDVVIASSYLPLAELCGLAPALTNAAKVLYFHENQLAFPVRREHVGGPDYHFGFTQLISGLAADAVVFNSAHNRDSFFAAAKKLLRKMPDGVPSDWLPTLKARAHVLHLPVAFPAPPARQASPNERPLIVWNHRWEHDKNPQPFFDALLALADEGHAFDVAVCGQKFRKSPAVFEEARTALGERVVAFGPLPRQAYWTLLQRADLCVSTAVHEFFGVAVIEAFHCGVRPVVPDRLAYVETIPKAYRYANDAALLPTLRGLLLRAAAGETLRVDGRAWTAQFDGENMLPRYRKLFEGLSIGA